MKNLSITMMVTGAVLLTSMSANAFAEDPVSPAPVSAENSIYLHVMKEPNIKLFGSVFDNPPQIELAALKDGIATDLGYMGIETSATACNLMIKTQNDFMLMSDNATTNGATGTPIPLSHYMIGYGSSANTGGMMFASNNDAPMPINCGVTADGNLQMSTLSLLPDPASYNMDAPAGIYNDTVNVVVEVAG